MFASTSRHNESALIKNLLSKSTNHNNQLKIKKISDNNPILSITKHNLVSKSSVTQKNKNRLTQENLYTSSKVNKNSFNAHKHKQLLKYSVKQNKLINVTESTKKQYNDNFSSIYQMKRSDALQENIQKKWRHQTEEIVNQNNSHDECSFFTVSNFKKNRHSCLNRDIMKIMISDIDNSENDTKLIIQSAPINTGLTSATLKKKERAKSAIAHRKNYKGKSSTFRSTTTNSNPIRTLQDEQMKGWEVEDSQFNRIQDDFIKFH